MIILHSTSSKSRIWETNRPFLSSTRGATCLICFGNILQQNKRDRECRRKALRHDGCARFRLSVARVLCVCGFRWFPRCCRIQRWYVFNDLIAILLFIEIQNHFRQLVHLASWGTLMIFSQPVNVWGPVCYWCVALARMSAWALPVYSSIQAVLKQTRNTYSCTSAVFCVGN